MTPDSMNNIANAIQLALTPVFMLAAISAMLNVMSRRLSRLIDRGITLTEKPEVIATYEQEDILNEIKMLERRRHITSTAITMFTVAALFVCLVIVTLFIQVMVAAALNWIIGALFILSTLGLVIGLWYFLREVYLAGSTVRIRMKRKS